jgi:hypothetical protein
MAEDKAPQKSAEQQKADEDYANTRPVNPVIRAAEEKLAAVEAGEYVDVERHEQIRERHGLATAASRDRRADEEGK